MLIKDRSGNFKLVKPMDKNMKKIEKVMGDDKKLQLIKDKEVKDIDIEELKEVDFSLEGLDNCSLIVSIISTSSLLSATKFSWDSNSWIIKI